MSRTLAHDAAVPHRDALLDPATVAARVGARPVRRVRATYQLGRRVRALHCVERDGARALVAATTFATRGRSASAYRDALPGVGAGPVPPVVHDAELDAVLWAFPNDRKLGSLGALTTCEPSLARVLGRGWAASELVAWAPEKSATVRCLDAAGTEVAFAKLYAEGAAAGARVHQLLHRRGAGSVVLPRVLAYAEDHATVFLEPLAGRRLSAHAGHELLAGMRRLGGALAALHALPADGLPRHDRVDRDRLGRAGELLGRACPDVSDAATELVAELEAHRPSPDYRLSVLHGDPHAKNAIVRNGDVALVDLDQACAGPAAADLGSVLAWLRYERRVGALDSTGERELADSFLAGYGELPDRAALAWHTAAALLVERALRTVSRVRRRGLLRLDGVLADAREVLA